MPEPDLSNLVRRYVDDELDAQERHGFEASLEEDAELRQAVDFERSLSDRVAAVLREPAHAPADLADRVRTRLAREIDDAPPGRMRFLDWLESPRRANVAAVAACLAIVAGAVLWGIFGVSIDRLSPGPGGTPLITDVAGFVSGEHGRCANDGSVRSMKLDFGPDQVAEELAAYLGAPVCVAELTDFGYTLLGGGHCMVPGPTKSAHIAYGRPAQRGREGAMASIFIVPNEGQFDGGSAARSFPGIWREIPGGPECQHKVLSSDDGRLIYFLVCCDDRDIDGLAERVAAAIREHAGTPIDPNIR